MEVEAAFKPAVSAAEFTPDDLAAADQLVQLSVSGGGDEHHDACSSASTLSSPRSVNNAEALVAAAREDDDDDEEEGGDENAGVVDRRARKRYRRVSELYAATRRVKTSEDAGRGGKRKSRDGIRTAS